MINVSFGQISPPGLGEAHTAEWTALGVRQKISNKWQSVSYIGLGRKSNPDNLNPLTKPAIWVLNQEFYRQFSPHWQYSVAVSYRRQDEYSKSYPYEHASPELQQEFRVYSRLSYAYTSGRIKLSPTVRQEFRKFYSPDFSHSHENFQLRSRLRLQLTVNLDEDKRHRLITGSEQLFATSNTFGEEKWTSLSYKESRFLLYYSYMPKSKFATFSLGYMNNWVKNSSQHYDAHYMAFDIILENPFHHKKHI